MTPYLSQPALLALFTAELVSFVILVHQGAVNFLLYRGSGHAELRTYAIWCVWSALLVACYLMLFVEMSERGFELVLHGITISAVFMMRYYTASVQAYLHASNVWLGWAIKLVPLAAIWPVASAVDVLRGGNGFYFQIRDSTPNNLLLELLQDVVPRNEIVPEYHVPLLVALAVAMTILITSALRAPRRDPWVMLGIVVTCAAIAYETTSLRLDWRYAMPVIFAANLIEVLRITYVSTLNYGRELASLEHDVWHQQDMIAAQIEAMAAMERSDGPRQELDELGHELRNPLAGGLMFLHAARKNSLAGRPVGPLLDKIGVAMSQLSDLIDRTLPGGGLPPDNITEPIADAVARAAVLCNARVEQADAHVDLSVPNDLWVDGPPAAVTQIFVNLLANACDAVKDRPDRTISIEAVRKEGGVAVSVRDPGPRPSELEALAMFQPRFTLKGDSGGSGLGLRVSQKVAQQLGGSLQLDPASPMTCFVVWLPLAPPSPRTRHSSPRSELGN